MKNQSRASEVNISECIKKVDGDQFALIRLAAAKARHMARDRSVMDRAESVGVSALLEIQNNDVDTVVDSITDTYNPEDEWPDADLDN